MQPTTLPPPRVPTDTDKPLFLRITTVIRITGLGRSTIYRMMAEKSFPSPVKLGRRTVAWRRADLEKWSLGLPAVTH